MIAPNSPRPARAPWPLALTLAATLASCSDTQPPAAPAEPPIPCNSAEPRPSLDPVAATVVTLHLDPATDANLTALRAEVPTYLTSLWSAEVSVVETDSPPEPDAAGLTVWISQSTAARDAAGSAAAALTDGYALRRTDDNLVIVYAPDSRNLAHGAYALLEELGVRFFHPMQEYVPPLGGVRLPKTLDLVRSSPIHHRGTQLHLLHPTEYFSSFLTPDADGKSLAEAKRLIDWLVKTGQNHVQWWVLDTLDWDAYVPYATTIIDYAHSRGVTAGVVVQLWGGASLQSAFALVNDVDTWQTQMETQLDRLLMVPWDGIELGMGEFLATAPEKVIQWLNHGVEYIDTKSPGTWLSVINHIGNYPELYVDYNGKTEYFYFLPQYADERIINTVHTVFLFDLYRDWGMYEHPNFNMHRDFLLEKLATRTMRYQPESAYWVTADIDVPVFLPMYLEARWTDIHNLDADIKAQGLPPLEGHVMFSSGHEWGYWLTDYLSARMLWEPEKDLNHFVSLYTDVFGSCSGDIHSALSSFIELQTKYLFDKRLVPYLSGEDIYDDIGTLAGIDTHPPRVPFETVLAMPEPERSAFNNDVLGGIRELAAAIEPIETTARRACAGSDDAVRPWCEELHDGIRIVRLRLLHSLRLYEAILDKANGGSQSGRLIAEAAALTNDAAVVIQNREKGYRFPVERLAGAYDNPSLYKFGYLRQASTQCLWRRQEEQADLVIQFGASPGPSGVRACTE